MCTKSIDSGRLSLRNSSIVLLVLWTKMLPHVWVAFVFLGIWVDHYMLAFLANRYRYLFTVLDRFMKWYPRVFYGFHTHTYPFKLHQQSQLEALRSGLTSRRDSERINMTGSLVMIRNLSQKSFYAPKWERKAIPEDGKPPKLEPVPWPSKLTWEIDSPGPISCIILDDVM